MKRELFRCDYCEIEKFDSETQTFINIPFSCNTKQQWVKHIKRPKHCLAVARNNILEDDLVKRCNYCDGLFTLEQYQKHKNHNSVYWISKNSNTEYYKECSCNNFIYNGKRFETLIELRTYAENRYENGRKKVEYIPKEKKVVSFKDRSEAIKQKHEQSKEKTMLSDFNDYKDKDEDISDIEKLKENRLDLNIKPIFEDYCNECGKPDNFIANYPIEKLDRWEVDVCDCGDSEESDLE